MASRCVARQRRGERRPETGCVCANNLLRSKNIKCKQFLEIVFSGVWPFLNISLCLRQTECGKTIFLLLMWMSEVHQIIYGLISDLIKYIFLIEEGIMVMQYGAYWLDQTFPHYFVIKFSLGRATMDVFIHPVNSATDFVAILRM
jgi:hypothetical protein